MMKGVCPGSVLEVWKLEPPNNPLMAYFNRERNVFGFSETVDIEETKTSEGWQR